MTQVRKPRAKRPTERVGGSPASSLDVGDTIEFSMTAEVRPPKRGSLWLKAGATITIRPGEHAEDATARVQDYVVSTLDTAVQEAMDA